MFVPHTILFWTAHSLQWLPSQNWSDAGLMRLWSVSHLLWCVCMLGWGWGVCENRPGLESLSPTQICSHLSACCFTCTERERDVPDRQDISPAPPVQHTNITKTVCVFCHREERETTRQPIPPPGPSHSNTQLFVTPSPPSSSSSATQEHGPVPTGVKVTDRHRHR